MAESKSHKFGQIIGDLLELAIYPLLVNFAKEHKLYLDRKGFRKARRGKKVTWKDEKNNQHDLDFVLERDGDETSLGIPVAFIETAWRRYTKHSRNKAQEIQGAILPLVETYKRYSPFPGVILAGEFTEGSLSQLKSFGFGVLYFTYDSIIKAFSKYHLNTHFDENTSEAEFKMKIDAWYASNYKTQVATELVRLNSQNVEAFFDSLSKSVSRHITMIHILPLYGREAVVSSIAKAIKELSNSLESARSLPIARYELIIRYNTGDRIQGSFISRESAISFLRDYQ